MRNFTHGWRPSLPDHRDFKYQVPSRIAAKLPAKVDQSQPLLPIPFEPPLDQQNIGSCGPNTTAKGAIFAAFVKQSLKVCPTPSRLFIYYNTRLVMGQAEGDSKKYLDQDSGVDNRSMMKALAQYGWCDETSMPYLTDRFTKKPSAALYKKAKPRAILKYEAVAQDLDVMRGAVAAQNPFVFGFTVYESMLTSAVDKTGVVPPPKSRKDSVAGGHDVLIVGYDDAKKRFKFQNHWWLNSSTPWGDGGYGYIPYAYATDDNLSGDFWTLTASGL